MGTRAVTSPFTSQELKEIRQHFPHTRQEKVYLNHAAVGPLSVKVVEAIQHRMRRRSSGNIDIFDRDAAVAEMTRRYMANLLNAPSDDRIAFVTNTSHGLNVIARGLEWEEGDHIIINDMEFPANVYPYENLSRKGVEVEKIASSKGKLGVDQIEKAIRPSTRMVSISAVQFLSGYRADLEAIGNICEEHDCWFVVDGIQALGAISVDVQKCQIDALVSGSHKWLMGPQGIATLYLTEQMQHEIVDHDVGWLSVEEPWLLFQTDQQLDESARRYELGTPNFNGLYGLNATLETYYQIGANRIKQQIQFLTTQLIDAINDLDPVTLATPAQWSERAGIVTIQLPEHTDNETFIEGLKKQHLIIALRENSLRISPHYYNTMEEIEKALDVIGSEVEG